jgi:hypothetical protein
MATKIEIGEIIVGEPIEIQVLSPDASDIETDPEGEKTLPIELVARHQSFVRHKIRTRLTADSFAEEKFVGKIKSAKGTFNDFGNGDDILRARAGDTVTVTLKDGQKETRTATGINVDDILIERPLAVRVVDEKEQSVERGSLDVIIRKFDGQEKRTTHPLQRDENEPFRYLVYLETYAFGADEAVGNERAIEVEEKDLVLFRCKGPGSKEYTWQVNALSEDRVDLRATGGVSPGKSFDVTIADANRIDEEAVDVYIANRSTGRIVEKRLLKVEGSKWKFSGEILTSMLPIEGGVEVQPKDVIDIVYLDRMKSFHKTTIEIIEPQKENEDLPWQKKYCCRAFFMPSFKPLLAELHCLEVRLSYYRATATGLSKSKRVAMVERCLDRAAKTLMDNHWDLTPAWEALHDAKRQEIYLLDDSEAEGAESIILAESKNFVSGEPLKRIQELLEKATKRRKREPSTNQWRGFLVSAMKILHNQQDSYFIRQNMIRDRMVMMTIFLIVFLASFFIIHWNSNISTALVNNRTIQSIFTEEFPLTHEMPGIAEDQTVDIFLAVETVIGQPLALTVFDSDPENQGFVHEENLINGLQTGCSAPGTHPNDKSTYVLFVFPAYGRKTMPPVTRVVVDSESVPSISTAAITIFSFSISISMRTVADVFPFLCERRACVPVCPAFAPLLAAAVFPPVFRALFGNVALFLPSPRTSTPSSCRSESASIPAWDTCSVLSTGRVALRRNISLGIKSLTSFLI